MIRPWHILVFLTAAAASALAFLPAALVAPPRLGALTYSGIEGSIWDMRVRDARMGVFAAGDVRVRPQPLALLRGRLDALLAFEGPAVTGDARIGLDAQGPRLLAAPNLTVAGAGLERALLGGAAADGRTRAQDLLIRFEDGACAEARGSVDSDVLAVGFPGVWRGPTLAGVVRCVGPAARIALEGASGAEAVEARLDLSADGGGEWSITARNLAPSTAIVLTGAGFTASPDGALSLTRSVQWFAH